MLGFWLLKQIQWPSELLTCHDFSSIGPGLVDAFVLCSRPIMPFQSPEMSLSARCSEQIHAPFCRHVLICGAIADRDVQDAPQDMHAVVQTLQTDPSELLTYNRALTMAGCEHSLLRCSTKLRKPWPALVVRSCSKVTGKTTTELK